MKGNRNTLVMLTAAISLTSVACGDRAASRGLEAEVARSIPKVETALGLTFKTPPVVETRSSQEVRDFVTGQLDDPATADELRGQEAVLKRLGMIPEDVSLRAVMLDVLEEQVAGYYDPKTRVLYVVDGASREMRNITIMHELIHALQDQYINLDSIQSQRGDDDRQTAAHAVIEGQATFEQMRIMIGQDMGAVIPGGWEGMRQLIRDEQARMPRFAAAPLVVQEMLLFPYLSGAEFIRRFREHYPDSLPLFDMPASTEQILHTQAYFGERQNPAQVVLPPLTGVTPLYENNLGEFGIRLFLFENLGNADEAMRGAMGWNGDRYVLFDTPAGHGIAWISLWDSAFDAGEFQDMISRHIGRRFRTPSSRALLPGERAGTISGTEYRVMQRTFFVGAAEFAGKPAVIYVDVPDGTSWRVMDFTRIEAREQ